MTRREIMRPDGATVAFTVIEPANGGAGLPPMVFVPGWLCTADSWMPTAVRLGRTRRCATVDLPGFGQSGAGSRDHWPLARFGADVAAVVGAISNDSAILVGHSMGGAVALEAAIAAPERCRRIVAVDSLIYPEFYDATDEAAIEPAVAAFARDFTTTIPAAMAAYVMPGRESETVANAIAQMAAANPDRGLAVLRDLLRWDVDARLPHVRSPVAVIAAAPLLSDAAFARWSGKVNLQTITDVGHFIMLDDPEAFDRVLSAVIADD